MKILQFGRSMIEMLGVLAIIGVLSIGGIVLYRRAVNNHQANVILDDVNRFAFVILERSGLPQGDVIPKGDFVESGLYTLEGYQDVEPEQFSITVFDVPRRVCEALLPKAAAEYAVRVNEHGSDDGPLYDLFHTDLCNGSNDIVLYFGDTDDLFDFPDCGRLPKCTKYSSDCKCIECEEGYQPSSDGGWCISGNCKNIGDEGCESNEDCCDPSDFCMFSNPPDRETKGTGKCGPINSYRNSTFGLATRTINGAEWLRSTRNYVYGAHNYGYLTWWTADNWCKRQKRADGSPMSLASASDLGCGSIVSDKTSGTCSGSVLAILRTGEWSDYNYYYWLSDSYNSGYAYFVNFDDGSIGWHNSGRNHGSYYALCH